MLALEKRGFLGASRLGNAGWAWRWDELSALTGLRSICFRILEKSALILAPWIFCSATLVSWPLRKLWFRQRLLLKLSGLAGCTFSLFEFKNLGTYLVAAGAGL